MLGSMSEHIFLLSLRVVYFGPQDDCLARAEDNSDFFPFYMRRSLETGLQKKGQQISITYKQSICFTHPRIKVSFVCETGSVSQACRLAWVHEFKTTKRSKSSNRITCPSTDIQSPIASQQPEQTDHRTKETQLFPKTKEAKVKPVKATASLTTIEVFKRIIYVWIIKYAHFSMLPTISEKQHVKEYAVINTKFKHQFPTLLSNDGSTFIYFYSQK